MEEGEGESNILVAIRVRPLSQKEVSVGDWDIVRIQENLIVGASPRRSSSTQLRRSSRQKTARCWRSTTAPRSRDTPSTASTATRPRKKSTSKQSNRSSELSFQAETQLSSHMVPLARARHLQCWAIRTAMASSNSLPMQRTGHRRHFSTH